MAIQKTSNFNLNKPDKYERNWDIPLNQNADVVDTQLKTLHDKDAQQDIQLLNLIANPIDEVATNLEVVDARLGADNEPRASVGTLIREIHSEVNTAKYSEPVEVTQPAISLPSTATTGQVSLSSIQANTYSQFVKNGNFANGITDWTGSGATLTAINNTLSITASGVNSSPRAIQNSSVVCQVGKKVFLRFKARVTNANASTLRMFVGGTTGGATNVMQVLNPIQNQWYFQSTILTLDSSFVGNLIISPQHTYADSTTANGKVMEVQEVMAIDLSAHSELTNLTVEQINQRIPNWFDGTKSTVSMRVSSVGKNLFDEKLEQGTIDITTGANTISTLATRWKNYIKVKAGLTYRLSRILTTNTTGTRFYDLNKNYVGNLGTFQTGITSIPITPTTDGYLRVVDNVNSLEQKFQLERGTIETPHEPYQDTKMYVPSVGGSVGNAKDEISLNQSTGQYEHRKKISTDLVLQSADFIRVLNYNNIDVVETIALPLAYPFIDSEVGRVNVYGFSEVPFSGIVGSSFDTVANIGKFGTRNNQRIYFALEKGTTLEQARTALAGKTLIYQLLVPEIKQLEGIGKLKAYPNGTIFIEPVVRITAAYNHVIVTDLPIKAIESVTKLDGEKRTPIDLSKVTFTAVGTSSQMQIQGALNEDVYEIVHEYPSELTTLPSTTYSYPLNMAGELKSIGDTAFSTDKEFKDYRAYNNAKLWYIEMRLVRLEL